MSSISMNTRSIEIIRRNFKLISLRHERDGQIIEVDCFYYYCHCFVYIKIQKQKFLFFVNFTGFHLSATVHQPHSPCKSKGTFNVAVTFDRGRITSCNCTCEKAATWCAHVIALCLFRIHCPNHVCLRAPVSEYLSRLRRDQLQKFAQYLISELPQQVLHSDI